MTKLTDKPKIAVIGGGAAGMMAAMFAADFGADVTLVEHSSSCGRKLRITGKGRCNVTNDSELQEFLRNVPTNPRFLYGALSFFSTADTVGFFENAGVPLKVERGKRVFPVSDKADDIVRAMVDGCRKRGVRTVFGNAEALILADGRCSGVIVDGEELYADALIVCTGGKSYSRTGSTGDGYAFARSAGHTVTEIRPSLVPITSRDGVCRELQGLSLKNVSLKITKAGSDKAVYEDFGEMMFTHFGITGPMVLSASAHIPDIAPNKYEAHINLKPALDEKTLDNRIIADFLKYHNRDFVNALDDLLPKKLIPVIVRRSGIPQRKKVNSITKEERSALAGSISDFKLSLSGFRPIEEAIVTKGGVSVKEIDPKTMGSRICEGLYFAGEVLDLDAYTGGFNLQIAFSTGALAGARATEYIFENQNTGE